MLNLLAPCHVLPFLQEVSDENYNEFFKQTFSEFLDPLAHVHFNVEVRTPTLQRVLWRLL